MDSLTPPEVGALSAASGPPRLAGFDSLFESAVQQVELRESGIRMQLSGDAGLSQQVRDLTAREAASSDVFSFAVNGTDDNLTLDIDVPPNRWDLLADLTARARRLTA